MYQYQSVSIPANIPYGMDVETYTRGFTEESVDEESARALLGMFMPQMIHDRMYSSVDSSPGNLRL